MIEKGIGALGPRLSKPLVQLSLQGKEENRPLEGFHGRLQTDRSDVLELEGYLGWRKILPSAFSSAR